MTPLILTYTGKHVNPVAIQVIDICKEDIAHALACCNRFAGHARVPINVAQHSVYVSYLCEGTGYEMQALFHDGSETYIGDITKWLKAVPEFEGYRKIEDYVQKKIYHTFGCATEMHPCVAAADKLMLRFEGEQAFGRVAWKRWIESFPTYDLITLEEQERIGPWSPWGWQQSKKAFLERYEMLLERS